VTGVIATLLAVGVIATLMLVGIRAKLPPPDPDWREHLSPPPPPGHMWIIWLMRYPVIIALVIAAILHVTPLVFVLFAVYLVLVVYLLAWSLRERRRMRRRAT
jgi:hypothetical protein